MSREQDPRPLTPPPQVVSTASPAIEDYFTADIVAQGHDRQEAEHALRALVREATLTDRAILIERTGQSRNRVWSHPGIISVLEDYAEAIRRD